MEGRRILHPRLPLKLNKYKINIILYKKWYSIKCKYIIMLINAQAEYIYADQKKSLLRIGKKIVFEVSFSAVGLFFYICLLYHMWYTEQEVCECVW